MRRFVPMAAALAALAMIPSGNAHGWGYPGGYGGFGWGGWGGASTVQGDMAMGLGMFAAGMGQYNQQTAIADSINADTVMRFNQYLYESQQEQNRQRFQRLERRTESRKNARSQIADRLRNNPEQRDIHNGDALNVALDEVSNPTIYTRTLAAAKVTVGGESIRNIPFSYARAAITKSFNDVTNKANLPAALMTPAFDSERRAFKALAAELRKQVDETGSPDSKTLRETLKVVETAEDKVAATLTRNSRERVAAERYLKALHGLLRMLETPALDVLLAGVEKRPQATLSELLNFMRSFNLRFGPARTPQQRQVYDALYPKLVRLRDEVAPAAAAASARAAEPTEADAEQFFSSMDINDLKKIPPLTDVPAANQK